ncbi:MAG TPA: hypothetical protein VIO81_06850, partial [Methyloversatilis sp.]
LHQLDRDRTRSRTHGNHGNKGARLGGILALEERFGGADLLAAWHGRQADHGDIKPVTPKVLESQQNIADKFFELKLVPRQVRVLDALPKEAKKN